MARFLCSAKADVNASLQGAGRISGQTPLIVASIRGHTEVVQFLCDAGADKDQGDVAGRAPLFEAACAGHSSVVRHLLQTRAEIDKARDVDSMTPLHGACYSGHVALVECLCAAGADTFRQSSAARNRPVDLAAEMDHRKIVFWLAKEMHIEYELREEPPKTSCVRRNEQTGGSTSWATPSPTSVGGPVEATRRQKETAAQKKRRRRTRAGANVGHRP